MADLKTIYPATIEEATSKNLERVEEKCSGKYLNSMKSWEHNWNALSPSFKFSAKICKVIYTTNAIVSLNTTYRKLKAPLS